MYSLEPDADAPAELPPRAVAPAASPSPVIISRRVTVIISFSPGEPSQRPPLAAGKDARLNLRRRRRAKLRGSSLTAEGRRIADQSRAVRATEGERVVRLRAIALGAAFHRCSRRCLFRQIQPFQQILKSRVVA